MQEQQKMIGMPPPCALELQLEGAPCHCWHHFQTVGEQLLLAAAYALSPH
jgi:hypothetical protein